MPLRGMIGFRNWQLVLCAASRIGMCALRNVRTRLIVRSFSSAGSFHGKTAISALGASQAIPVEVRSRCPSTSSGRTKIGVRQFLMKPRDTLYKKSGRSVDTYDHTHRHVGLALPELGNPILLAVPGYDGRVSEENVAFRQSGSHCRSC